jgi:hypothetical protein
VILLPRHAGEIDTYIYDRNDVHNFSVNTHVPSKVYGELYHDIKYIKKQHEHFIGNVMYICTQMVILLPRHAGEIDTYIYDNQY